MDMPRTVIHLEPEDEAWLLREARSRGLSVAALVREAIRFWRLQSKCQPVAGLADALRRTSGCWKQGDGLAWQERLRAEGEDPAP